MVRNDGYSEGDGAHQEEDNLSDIVRDNNNDSSVHIHGRDMGNHFLYICKNIYKVFIKVEKIVPTSLRLNPLYIKVDLIYLNLFIHGVFPFILRCFTKWRTWASSRACPPP